MFLRLTRHPVYGNLIARSNTDMVVAVRSLGTAAVLSMMVLAVMGRFEMPFWVLWLAITTVLTMALFPIVERFDPGLIYERGVVARPLHKKTALAFKDITTYYYEADNLTPDPSPGRRPYKLHLHGRGEHIPLPGTGDLTPSVMLSLITKITDLRMPVYDELFDHGEELDFGAIKLSQKMISFPSVLGQGRSEFKFYQVESYDVRGATMVFRMRNTAIAVRVDLKAIPNFMCFLKLLKQWVLTARQPS